MNERSGLCNGPVGHALEYARRWPVMPLAWIIDDGVCGCNMGPDCPRPGKHPLIKGGLYRATQDAAIIKNWWVMWLQANIGFRTGLESGLLVLDVDPRNGGSESLERLLSQYGGLPDTLVCATGGGGPMVTSNIPVPAWSSIKAKFLTTPVWISRPTAATW